MTALLVMLLMAWTEPAMAQAILIEDGATVGRQATSGESRSIYPISQRSHFRQMEEEGSFSTADELRTRKRMGIAAQLAGTTGLFGVLLELNLSSNNSANIGFGGGPGYSSMSFQWKHQFNGRFFSPYLGVGYARWYNSSDAQSLNKATPSILSSKFLSEDQKRSGKFEVDLLTPSVGVLYHMLSGPQVGVAYFGEVVFLTEFSKPQPAPMAALGAVYYF
jgi:hypothetical protein